MCGRNLFFIGLCALALGLGYFNHSDISRWCAVVLNCVFADCMRHWLYAAVRVKGDRVPI